MLPVACAVLTIAVLAPPSSAFKEGVQASVKWQACRGAGEVAITPDGSVVATLESKTGMVTVWSGKTGKQIARVPTPAESCELKISSDGKVVAVLTTSGAVQMRRVNGGGKILKSIDSGYKDASLEFGPDCLISSDRRGFSVYRTSNGTIAADVRYTKPDEYLLAPPRADGWVVVADTSSEDSGFYVWNWKKGNGFVNVPVDQQVTRMVKPDLPGVIQYQTLEFDPSSGLATTVCSVNIGTRKKKIIQKYQTGQSLASFLWYELKGTQIAVTHYPGKPTKLFLNQPGKAIKTLLTAEKDRKIQFEVDGTGKVIASIDDEGTVRVWRF